MSAYNDPSNESDPPRLEEPAADQDAIKVYDRPKRVVPVWMWALYVVIGLALLWVLFTYVF